MSEEVDNQEKSKLLKQLEEVDAIKEKLESIAKRDQSIAEAKKATLEAELSVNTESLKGTTITTDDKFGYMAELVAYDSLNDQVKILVEEIVDKIGDNKNILLLEDQKMAADEMHMKLVKEHMEALDRKLAEQISENAHLFEAKKKEKVIPETVMGTELSITAATAIAGSVANFIDMFRKEYTIKGKGIDLSETALRALIVKELKNGLGKDKNYTVYLPNFYCSQESELIKKFGKLVEQRFTLQNQVHQLSQQYVEPKEEVLAKLEEGIKNLADSSLVKIEEIDVSSLVRGMRNELNTLRNEKQQAETAILKSQSLIKTYDESIEALLEVAEGQTTSSLEAAVLREYISNLKISHLLYATVVSGGGEAITIKEYIILGNTAYIGGSVVSYILATPDGNIVDAGMQVKAKRLDYKLSSKEGTAWSKVEGVYESIFTPRKNEK